MRRMRPGSLLLLALLAGAPAARAQDTGWRANPEVVRRTAQQRPEFNYDEARVPPSVLPDLFGARGAASRTRAAWRERRAELLALFRDHVYGRAPGKPE